MTASKILGRARATLPVGSDTAKQWDDWLQAIELIPAGRPKVIDRDLTAPPGSPADGDIYFIATGSTPTGAWAGQAGKFAYWLTDYGAWQFATPREGTLARVVDEAKNFQWVGTAFVEETGGGGGAPDAHAASHQNGGSDEINVAGLSGALADPQTPAAHNQAWSTITATPTTLAAYGITDAASDAELAAAVTGLLDFKGSTDCSTNPNYPVGLKGDAYYVSVAGKIGGASGKSVEIGDVYVASADNAGGTEAAVGTSWFVLEHNLVGAVIAGGDAGTPSALVLTNATGLPTAGLVNDAVTYAKMQNVSATDKLLGRSTAGAGDVEEIAATSFGRGVLAAASNAAIVDLIGGAASVGTGGLVRANDVVISPTQLTADTDDWNPTSLATASRIRLDTDANLRYLSSIVAQAGRRLRLTNISANTLIIKDKRAALGTAANRFECGGQDLPLFPGDVLDMHYDDTSAFWRVVAPMAKVIPPARFGKYLFTKAIVGAQDFLTSFVAGTGAANTLIANDGNSPFFYLNQTTGTTATGVALLYSASQLTFLFSAGLYWRYRSRIRVPTASDVTETYNLHNGFGDSGTGGGNPVDGVGFRYAYNVNSGNWVGFLRSNSSETAVNLSAAPLFSATAYFEIAVVVTPTRVEWYQNGVLIGSTTTMTNLPSAAGRAFGYQNLITKTAGTTARVQDTDYIEIVGYKGVP